MNRHIFLLALFLAVSIPSKAIELQSAGQSSGAKPQPGRTSDKATHAEEKKTYGNHNQPITTTITVGNLIKSDESAPRVLKIQRARPAVESTAYLFLSDVRALSLHAGGFPAGQAPIRRTTGYNQPPSKPEKGSHHL
jgi:hypothetical protein